MIISDIQDVEKLKDKFRFFFRVISSILKNVAHLNNYNIGKIMYVLTYVVLDFIHHTINVAINLLIMFLCWDMARSKASFFKIMYHTIHWISFYVTMIGFTTVELIDAQLSKVYFYLLKISHYYEYLSHVTNPRCCG